MKNDTNALRSDYRDCELITEVRKLKKELADYKAGFEEAIQDIFEENIYKNHKKKERVSILWLRKHFLKGE